MESSARCTKVWTKSITQTVKTVTTMATILLNDTAHSNGAACRTGLDRFSRLVAIASGFEVSTIGSIGRDARCMAVQATVEFKEGYLRGVHHHSGTNEHIIEQVMMQHEYDWCLPASQSHFFQWQVHYEYLLRSANCTCGPHGAKGSRLRGERHSSHRLSRAVYAGCHQSPGLSDISERPPSPCEQLCSRATAPAG